MCQGVHMGHEKEKKSGRVRLLGVMGQQANRANRGGRTTKTHFDRKCLNGI